MKKPLVLLVLALGLAALLWQVSSLFDSEQVAPPDLAPPAPETPEVGERSTAPADAETLESTAARTEREQVETADVATDPATKTGALLLRAVLEDGTPVPEVAIYLTPEKAKRIGHGTTEHITDAEGLARVEGLRPGEVRIHCPRGPYRSVDVIAGQETEVLLEFKNVVDVRGVVRDSEGRPVAGADVWMISWRRDWLGTRHLGRTEADGTFVARSVHRERSLGATADGFVPSALVDLELVDTADSPVEIELVLQFGGGNLRGSVRDHEGRPVPHARVAVGESPTEYGMRNDGTNQEFWCARVETTDASGAFAFTGLDAGRLPLHVAAVGFPVYEGNVEILFGEAVRHDVQLTPGMSVHGVVTNDAGEVVPDALVLALDAPFVDPFPTQGPTEKGVPFHRPAVRSDDSGAYRLDYLPAGEVHLHASKGTSFWDDGKFLGAVQETLRGAAGEIVEWNPVLSAGHAIRGRVVHADGHPMGNVFVSATDDDDRRYAEGANEDGKFVIPGLENRAYRISVQFWDAPDDARPLVQEDVWPSNVELLLTASFSKTVEEKGTVSVRIDDRAERIEGKGAVVFAYDRGWYFSGSGEEDGVFSTELPPGRYQARALSGDTVVGSSEWFDLAPGEVRDLGAIRTRRAASLIVTVIRPPELADNAVRAMVEMEDRPRTGGRQFPEGEDELTFEDLLEGPAEVTVWGVGVARESRTVEIASGAPTTVAFRLRAAVSVTIHIESAQTEGFGRLTITLRRANGELYHEVQYRERWGTELPLDTAMFVPSGRFTVEVTTTNGLTAKGEITVESLTEGTTLSLVLE